MSIEQVRIFDTTLRDGEQAPGFSMTEEGKLRMARALAALKVDVIEAGFAAASPGDARAISRVAENVEGPIICSLARAIRGDIEASAAALRPAARKRIHVFLGTSPIHREAKLKMDRAKVLESIRSAVAHARGLVDDVEFSAEDAIRTERDFLVECLPAAAAEGATTLNVPDTVGYTTPDEIYELFRFLSDNVARPEGTIFSTHCHNDLGMAVANALAAVRGGARQIECAVNGIGERAGNSALEDVVMALKTRADAFGVTTGVDTTKIMIASRTLAQVTNTPPPRNKAIVGANAFAHESGIHQHGILQNRETYEIMKPEDIGLATDGIILGKHSGRHALAARAKALGYVLDGEKLDRAFTSFKEVADDVGIVDTARLLAILSGTETGRPERPWTLSKVDIRAPVSANAHPVARVELEHGERGRVTDIASAPGALDAAFAAVSQIMGLPARVDQLEMQYVAAESTEPAAKDGQGANVLVEIAIDVEGEIFAGRARARDILPCCVAAYIDAASNAEAVRRVRQGAPKEAQAAWTGRDALFKIVILPGDGIGPEVAREAVACLELLSERCELGLSYESRGFGGAAIDAHGEPLPAATLEACRDADAILLGAIGGPKWDKAEQRPETGLLKLRASLGLFANLRPARVIPGLEELSPLKSEVAAGADVLVVRELTGGLYFGEKALADEFASDLCTYTREEVERIAHVAFRAARGRRGKVTSVDKANVLATSKLWRKVVEEVAAQYPDIQLDHLYVDAAAMALVTSPTRFDVLLTENLFGDILSDEMSVISGSIGLLASASSGADGASLYEPIHGSAPDIAGQDVANPAGAIASAAMLLEQGGFQGQAVLLTEALEQALAEGSRTRDLGGTMGCSAFGARVRELLETRLEKHEAWLGLIQMNRGCCG